MAFCPQCGSPVADGARFCSNCGSQLTAATQAVVEAAPTAVTYTAPTTVYTTPVAQTSYVQATATNDYRIILVDMGSCRKTDARELMEDVLGYTSAEAKELTNNLPVEIAHALTLTQAQYIAQAFTEYGMQVSVCNNNGYVDLGLSATSSVYNSDGSFVKGMLAAVASLTVLNRVREYTRWNWGDPYRYVFQPRFRITPPIHIRRRPEPMPEQRRGGPRPAGGSFFGAARPSMDRPTDGRRSRTAPGGRGTMGGPGGMGGGMSGRGSSGGRGGMGGPGGGPGGRR